MQERVLVLGASLKPYRYSHIAVKTLISNNHQVTAVGNRAGDIDEVRVMKNIPEELEHADTITLYLGPNNQKQYYEHILELNPRRIIFNPGTENEELAKLARKHNIDCQEACTIFMLNQGTF